MVAAEWSRLGGGETAELAFSADGGILGRTIMTDLPKMLSDAPPRLRGAFEAAARPVRLSQGQLVLAPGQACEGMAFAMHGTLRVYLVGMDGREITLYRVREGESCVLSAACILGNRRFPASAEIESDLSGLLVPAPAFREWVGQEPFWREYVFGLLGERLASVLAQFESTAFDPVEARIARWLLDTAHGDPLIASITQQALANELGSAREVVNRVLNRWRATGWVSLDRGVIQLLDPVRLRNIAAR